MGRKKYLKQSASKHFHLIFLLQAPVLFFPQSISAPLSSTSKASGKGGQQLFPRCDHSFAHLKGADCFPPSPITPLSNLLFPLFAD